MLEIVTEGIKFLAVAISVHSMISFGHQTKVLRDSTDEVAYVDGESLVVLSGLIPDQLKKDFIFNFICTNRCQLILRSSK